MADFELVKGLQNIRHQSGAGAAPSFTNPEPPPSFGSAGGGVPSVGPVGEGAAALKTAMRAAAAKYGWSGSEWNMLDELIQRESSWNPQAQNPTSTAWGLGQFLDMHWGPGGYLPNGRNSTNSEQISGILRYIKDRYGRPSAAIAHHNRMNWY